jgi:cyclophilin family peptidyl-prolyl cis-trans isomerase/HEAT repeat protein
MKSHISNLKWCTSALLLLVSFAANRSSAQVPMPVAVQILKAEDARRYDSTLETLMKSPNADVRKRAALAAGRIGNDAAIPALASLLGNDGSGDVRAMAAFAIGEIESVKGADAVLTALKADNRATALVPGITARAVEAAGKIAAANPRDPKTKDLGSAIVEVLKTEGERAKLQDTPTILLALTAVLRARPGGADEIVTRCLTNYDERVRADAANTIARLKSRSAADTLRKMVVDDPNPNARANAARALGNMQDKLSLNELLSAAVEDKDARVRVSAIRALGGLEDRRAARHLLERGRALLANYEPQKTENRHDKNEALEIATSIGQLLPKTADAAAIRFLTELNKWGEYRDRETTVALARIAPKEFINGPPPPNGYKDFLAATAYAHGLAEVAEFKDADLNAQAGEKLTAFIAGMAAGVRASDQVQMLKAMPDLTRALAALKPDNLNQILLGQVKNEDVFIRAAAAELIAEQPRSDENVEALRSAAIKSQLIDKHDNDAKLAILDALAKVDKKAGVGTFLLALNDPDYLVRRKAFEILSDKSLEKDSPGLPTMLESARAKHKDQVLPYASFSGSKLGQVLNTDVDYRRALSRKNGSVKAVLTTEKGAFTIDFFPEDAPLTVDNFIKLARAGYFNGLAVHRVVPNFVMQDGDPRGDGNGGTGWSIRCEINMRAYDRGAVGMALSGKDTGGSQWFVTHAPEPHLDGGYTVFGQVNETDMKVVDQIVRGDRILTVRIIGR